MTTPGHANLGALLRNRRTSMKLSMEALAERAQVSRSSIYRVEKGTDVLPRPQNVARLLLVLGIEEDEARQVLPGDDWGGEVVYWLERAEKLNEVSEYVAARAAPSIGSQPDLVLIGEDQAVIVIQIKDGKGEDEQHLDRVARAMRAAGYMVTVPA